MTPDLAAKLGLKPDMDAAVIAPPEGPPVAIELPVAALADRPRDLWLVFCAVAADVSRAVAAAAHYRDGDRLWCAYPKGSSPLATRDLSRDRGWEALAALGFIPVTAIAIDADWSALRFRRAHEPAKLTRAGSGVAR